MQEHEKKRKIVVMGGSFNPPTIAHLRLMRSAMDGIGAQAGIFAPSNHTYVKIKMRRAKRPNEVWSEEMRKKMLEAMCVDDERLMVEDVEYHRQGGKTYETMEHVQQKNPDAELYFVLGGDKLNVLGRWHRWREFLANFKIIVFKRDGVNPMAQIFGDERLRDYKDTFVILPQPEGVDGISSTAVREKLRCGERADEMLHEGVVQLIEEQTKGEKTDG